MFGTKLGSLSVRLPVHWPGDLCNNAPRGATAKRSVHPVQPQREQGLQRLRQVFVLFQQANEVLSH